jgi:hypothetical protein
VCPSDKEMQITASTEDPIPLSDPINQEYVNS